MGRKNREKPLIEGLEITALAAEGKALGRWNEQVIFVPLTVPGDVVDVQVTVNRRRYMEGYAVRLRKRSPLRTEPFCPHFGICGGCRWQNLPYREQLAQKQRQVEDQLRRIGHVELPEISPIIGSERTECYRNKLEYTFSPHGWVTFEEMAGGNPEYRPALGFHIPGRFDKVLDIERCFLQPEPSDAIRLETKRFCIENGYEFYDIRAHKGLMRNLIIRTSSTGQTMVVAVFGEDDPEKREAFLKHLAEKFPGITSLMYMVNTKYNDSVADLPAYNFTGPGYITERMEDLEFIVGPKSFYQTNSRQAYELYKVVRDFAALTGTETVYDLYTGTGTIANFIARNCRSVVGIEYVPEAIDDARMNSERNGITNTSFHAGDMKDLLTDAFVEASGKPDVVVLDPPRAGVHPAVLETILKAAPERIVYVSCNPATQARDLAILAAGYSVRRVQPVDMFPHTHHVENVVELIRTK